MRKGPIIIIIGIALALLSVPFALGYTLYDERTLELDDLEEYDSDLERTVYKYEFKDLPPGKITVRADDSYYGSGNIQVVIEDEDHGEVIDEYELDPNEFFWDEEDTFIRSKGDYELTITVYESLGSNIDVQVKYSGKYSRDGLISAILCFPSFLIAGICLTIWGAVMVYRKKRGHDKEPAAVNRNKDRPDVAYEDDKRKGWDEYRTSPRRREIWFESLANPYDDVPTDYYSKKMSEAEAFNQRWHQRLGDDMENKIMSLRGKKEKKNE